MSVGNESPRPPVREVIFAFGISVVLTVAFDLVGRGVPFIRANILAIVAAIFLYVPIFILPKGGPTAEDYGLTTDGWARGAKWGFGMALLTFVFFLPGYHLWATQGLNQTLRFDPGAYVRMSDRYYGTPVDTADGQVHIFQYNDVIRVHWQAPDAEWRLELSTDARILPISEHVPGHLDLDEGTWIARGSQERHISLLFHSRGGRDLVVSALVDGDPIDGADYALGPASEDPARSQGFLSSRATAADDGVRVPLNIRWIFLSILVQLLLVALPEEFFYRGYLQRRLDEARPSKRWKIGPVFLTRSILIVSVAFALGHFVIGWYPERLAVFFPSLMFGFLRDRTDGISASIFYHAACNLMVQITSVHYIY